MKVETWPIDRVIPYARNPRKNEASVDAVAASIKEFGWRVPIVVDADGVIVTGHTRHKAARRLGMTEVPVHVADGLTAAQVKAYRIADNSAGSKSEWDAELLGLELGELPDFDAAAFGLDFSGPESIPQGNKPIDEDAMKDTQNECPKCGFKW
jgi:ParB-like chromosome segregation protein Spo0J